MIEVKNRPLLLWLALRLITFAVASIAFLYEQSSRSLRPLGRLLLAPWYNYDTLHYVHIVSSGYRSGDMTAGFHPLYPWTAKVVSLLIHEPLLSLMIVSSIAGLLFTFAFYRLALLDLDDTRAWSATALCLCWPASLAIFLPYTEALFLLLAVCCLFAARRGQFWLAGLAGGLAALTRQQGIFLVFPLAWEIWESTDRDWRKFFGLWHKLPSIALVPMGYAAWIAYRAFALNDVKPDFSSGQRFIYSVMISPAHYHVYQEQQFTWPWTALMKAGIILWNGGSHLSAWGDVILGLFFIALFIVAWGKLRISYLLYSIAIVLTAFSIHMGQLNPYMSLPRHLLPAFPVFIGFAARYRFKRLPVVLCSLAICQGLLLCSYVWETWVP